MKQKTSKTTTRELNGDFQQMLRMQMQGGKDPYSWSDLLIPICELVDNAIDSGATTVSFKVTGNTFVVTDNGEGYPSKAAFDKCFTDICTPLKDGQSTIGSYNYGHKMMFFTSRATEEKIVTYPPHLRHGLQGRIYLQDGRVMFDASDISSDVNDRGTTIVYSYKKDVINKLFSDRNVRFIKQYLATIYGVRKNLQFMWDNRNFNMDVDFFRGDNTEMYATTLFVQPLRVGKKTYGRMEAYVLNQVPGRPWLGRIAGIEGKRVVETNEALSKYFGGYTPNEHRLRVFIWFNNEILGAETVSITNEKDSFSIPNEALLEEIGKLEKKAKKLYAEEVAKEKRKENFDLEDWIQKQVCLVIEDFTAVNLDGKGKSASNGPSDRIGEGSSSSSNHSDSDHEEAAKRNHGIRPFVHFTNVGPGRTFTLDRDAREVYINRDERLFTDLSCLRHQKQGVVPFRHLFHTWYLWRQKHFDSAEATQYLEDCGVVKEK